MRWPVAFLIAVATSGCLNFGKVDDAKIPGELLGTYAVRGALVETTCGDGAFEASDPWRFDVKLSRFHEDLYWLNGREVIAGSIAPDGLSFSFSTRVEAEVAPADRGRSACVINRADSAKGRLSSADLDVERFSASLGFAFTAVDGSDCESWVGGPDGARSLPCEVSYELVGIRRGGAPVAE